MSLKAKGSARESEPNPSHQEPVTPAWWVPTPWCCVTLSPWPHPLPGGDIWQLEGKWQEAFPDVSCCCARPQFVSSVWLGSTWMSVHTWEDPRGGWRKDHTHGPILGAHGVCVLELGTLVTSALSDVTQLVPTPGPARGSDSLGCHQMQTRVRGSCREEDLLLLYFCHLQDRGKPGRSLSALSSLDRFPFPCTAGCS